MNTATVDVSRYRSPLVNSYVDRADLHQVLPLETDEHVVAVRKAVREHAIDMKLSLVDQTKLVTAASELARNTIKYGGGGVVVLERLRDGLRKGLRLVFADTGPGIEDIELALRDGYTSGGGLGLGLGGTKRLVDEFNIDSRPGEGAAVAIIKWKI
ncbi:anti-sigma regulatory factor [Pseudoduganella sp. FT26W]|jgi:serine/threonine-protein kinase RsbT|uniref:Anti-sigma regulatory factor n=2 Tax=Duganella TaxID=75654 RepID=A0A6L5QFU1_9BURK|nr:MULTISPECIES: anti-sigma regulatory factor [Duganella]MRW84919.1 anti-sigma regulatory factor [Duganella aquatilis]MRX08633.1 anti-sigma regulatory factor [Duganella alba]MRX18195.1 anti-sigma regulatory factor [Duganella alba]